METPPLESPLNSAASRPIPGLCEGLSRQEEGTQKGDVGVVLGKRHGSQIIQIYSI